MIARTLASRLAAAALAGIAAASGALAQNVPAPPPQTFPPAPTTPTQPLAATPIAPAAPQYQVEVLIFAHREFDRGEEQFSHETARAAPAGQQALRTPPVFDESTLAPLAPDAPLGQPPPFAGDSPLPDLNALAADPNEFRFRLLRPDELQLNSQYRTIERNAQAYLPLLHAGWVQPGLPENDARPFDLAMLGAKNPMGTIRLYLSRFLHVKLDLSYQGSAPPAAPVAGNELAELPIAPRYFLVADRPTRSGELHYFDHPAFGVLIKVTPVRPEQAAPGTPGARPAA
jgi:hypothetical protein